MAKTIDVEYHDFAPPSELKSLIDGTWAWAPRESVTRVNNFPDVNAGLLFSLTDERLTLKVCGAASKNLLIDLPAGEEQFAIVFRPGMAPRTKDYQPSENLNELLPAKDFFGMNLDQLGEELHALPTLESRALHLTATFAKRNKFFNFSPSKPTQNAIQQMKQGSLKISQIAENLGMGLRSFERLFKNDTGMSPKQFARIMRFRTAMKAVSQNKDLSLSELSHELGYSDQAHFIHDFRQFTGVPPSLLESAPHFVAFLQSLPSQDVY